MFEKLYALELSYDNFFDNNEQVPIESRGVYKLIIIQSIIRIIFSKEKKNLYSQEEFYEFNILKKIIDKNVKDTADSFGDDYRALFRKDDLYDDLIKYMFYTFGNDMILESLVCPLTKKLEEIGITSDAVKNNDPILLNRNIKIDEYEALFNIIIQNLSKRIPQVLKILLRIIYESMNKYFTIEKKDYSPLYTCLIFNFLINPRVQRLYSIDLTNCIFVKSLNRLIKNTCFDNKFDEMDALSGFNDLISECHLKIQNMIEEIILPVTLDDKSKHYLKDLFTEKYLVYPKFLFYWDSQLLSSTISGGVDNIIAFKEYS